MSVCQRWLWLEQHVQLQKAAGHQLPIPTICLSIEIDHDHEDISNQVFQMSPEALILDKRMAKYKLNLHSCNENIIVTHFFNLKLEQ